MCTGFTFQAKNSDIILGRTMDYDYPLTGHLAVQPRNFYWESRVDYKGTTKYGFTGAGSDMEGFIFDDGVNEHGLAISNQYDRDYASYATEIREGYINISQTEVLTWALGYNKTIDELINNAPQVNVVGHTLNDINEAPPLHFHVSDKTGRTAEITFVEGRIVAHDNPVGVLTNNPDLNWHYENLKNYVNVTPYKPQSKTFNGIELKSLGNEGGTFGLPGGYTSGERFVRAAYLINNMLPDDGDDAVLDAFRILDSVSIPKGAVRPSENEFHYTWYQTVFNLTNRTVYVSYYNSNRIAQLQLTEDLLNSDDLVIFEPIPQGIATEQVK
ncbi:linear amide C-N hydrolase [Staphylococcus devriesei]|uniref:choloylglycine hydrolase family protein n=1 Tax=Staphylococcus devriesei TaxID=586733 RepID=UPI000E6A2CDD|nr:choloylglycine hydrolase family protein [Staphylococcus devriesei]RIL73305.1 linear amide C-N hydrolase [Staphylococcus devriesei]